MTNLRPALLHEAGAEVVLIDDGPIATQLTNSHAPPFDKVSELIGSTTLEDSVRYAKDGRMVCMTVIVGNAWSFESFAPMDVIPIGMYPTSYTDGAENRSRRQSKERQTG